MKSLKEFKKFQLKDDEKTVVVAGNDGGPFEAEVTDWEICSGSDVAYHKVELAFCT